MIITNKLKDFNLITLLPPAGRAFTFFLQQKKVNKPACQRSRAGNAAAFLSS